MTRHFFAFLALLSGLAALSGPAQASAVDPLACAARLAECGGEERASEQVAANAPLTAVWAKTGAPVRFALASLPAFGGPVLMGIDRAYE